MKFYANDFLYFLFFAAVLIFIFGTGSEKEFEFFYANSMLKHQESQMRVASKIQQLRKEPYSFSKFDNAEILNR